MRKNIILKDQPAKSAIKAGKWLNLEQLAQVEITSEDQAFPIEGAFAATNAKAWKAAEEGSQHIRLIFDTPQQLKNIYICFEEQEILRTQEFVLRWSSGFELPMQDIVRQQYNFSPGSSTIEEESYVVDLKGVKILELHIIPDLGNPHAKATLSSLLLA